MLAMAQKFPTWCNFEMVVMTLTTLLTAAFCLYSKPFLSTHENFFTSVDFILQTLVLIAIAYSTWSGHVVQWVVIGLSALMVVTQVRHRYL